MASSGRARLDSAVIAAAYEQHAAELHRFLRGVLRDDDLAGDCLQITFVKAIEQGHTADATALKGWLFRVAFNVAMQHKRGERAGQRAREYIFSTQPGRHPMNCSPAELAIQADEIQRLRQALDGLPTEQRTVVQMRMFDHKTFALIAAELNVPLGTVLTRMRSALDKLRRAFGNNNSHG